MKGIVIDPDGEEIRKARKRETFFASCDLKKSVRYDEKTKAPFRPLPSANSILAYQLGIVEEKKILHEVVDCFGGDAALAAKFLASRNDLVEAAKEAKERKVEIDEFNRAYQEAMKKKEEGKAEPKEERFFDTCDRIDALIKEAESE